MPFPIHNSQNIKYKDNKKKIKIHPVHQALIQTKHRNFNSPYQFFCTLSIIKTFIYSYMNAPTPAIQRWTQEIQAAIHSYGLQYLAGLWYDLGGGPGEFCATVIGKEKGQSRRNCQ